MTSDISQRRQFLASLGGVGLGLLTASPNARAKEEYEEEVSANEDLMREHGIIRRALLVYGEAARRARQPTRSLPLAQLGETAMLFRSFAEDYHERVLEEALIFPLVRKLQGPTAKLPDVLLAQHRRGREITDYVRHLAAKPALGANAGPLASALEGFVRMYEPHAAREDTELFPAWKAALGQRAYAEMGEQFEEIEHRSFGRDGFHDALERIARIEAEFGLSDLSDLTAPPPPIDAER
jgi:hemerythrin-like domain-containing protein